MLTYSVFDYDGKMFRYFRAPGHPPRGQRGSAKGATGEHGLSPESLCAELPVDAVFLGRGDLPRGIMARERSTYLSGLGDADSPRPLPTWLVAAVWALPLAAGYLWLRSWNRADPGRLYPRRRRGRA